MNFSPVYSPVKAAWNTPAQAISIGTHTPYRAVTISFISRVVSLPILPHRLDIKTGLLSSYLFDVYLSVCAANQIDDNYGDGSAATRYKTKPQCLGHSFVSEAAAAVTSDYIVSAVHRQNPIAIGTDTKITWIVVILPALFFLFRFIFLVEYKLILKKRTHWVKWVEYVHRFLSLCKSNGFLFRQEAVWK